MLLSHYGMDVTATAILAELPGLTTDDGAEWGTVAPELAAFCMKKGFHATVHTFDCRIVDLSWADFPPEKMLARLREVKSTRLIPTLGKNVTDLFVQGYIDLLEAGGELRIRPYVTSALLDELLTTGPFMTTVCMGAFYGKGRARRGDDGKGILDDVRGSIGTHFVIVRGRDEAGRYLIADPGKADGLYAVEREHLLGSIMAAQRDCENVLFLIDPIHSQRAVA